jgi:TolB-like protein/class 3 adenylate cyclase/Flp pilus assembly protein TadD
MKAPEDRRLAAIMFTDIVGYTALMGKDEHKAFQLLHNNRRIHKPLIKKYRGEWLKEMGDGILASFKSSSDAVRCATEIQNTAKNEGIDLRIGIHEGEVVFAGGDVLGDGVNVASRLEEVAEKGCINISEAVYKDIKNKPGITTEFIGEKFLKNVDEAVKIYKVECDEPKSEEKWSTLEIEPEKGNNTFKYYVIGGLALIIAAILLWKFLPQKIDENLEKSIAVLPFENLGPEEQAYFTDGMTEEITSLLATIKTLSVISRKSSIHYAKTDKTIKQIGKELGVSYILEGTVRWAISPDGTDKVRITPQLIRVSDDTHIWTDNYDRQITDIFEIQSEIAQKVVKQLGISLMKGEQNNLVIQPTQNLEAYQAYLRGRYYVGLPHFSLENWEQAIKNFQQAVKLDTGFALAYAELARSHARLYNLRYDLSETRLKKSDQAADRALEFGSDQPGVQIAIGYYYLWAYRNFKMALEHLEIAEKDLPNNVEILRAIATIYEPQGLWKESIQILEKASKLSPMDAAIHTDRIVGYWLTRKYEEAVDASNKAISLAPETNWPYLYKAYTYMCWVGANEQSRNALNSVNPEHEFYLWTWYLQEIGEGNYHEAIRLLSDTTDIWISNKLLARPKPLLSAFINAYLDKHELALNDYKSARELLETKVREYPDDPRYHSSLGMALAGIGQKEKAIKEGKIAVQLLPMSKDAFYGIQYVQDLIVIYIMVGEFDLAFVQIEYLLSIPSWLSVPWLEMDIRYTPLRSLPRYKDLLVKYGSS